ncbi:MAG: hypothetical protein E4H07_09685 [Nitrosomonadales bacterium]|nr:MAG: hypothetical protein E4H07_09685 [Nitrosomonadales bacterium]
MDTLNAVMMGMANRNKELKVFDWNKAAKLIKDSKVKYAEAGLAGSWEHTGGIIFRDGKPASKKNTYVYLASIWAIPQLFIDGFFYDCYKMQSDTPNWDSDTFWPKSARKIIGK